MASPDDWREPPQPNHARRRALPPDYTYDRERQQERERDRHYYPPADPAAAAPRTYNPPPLPPPAAAPPQAAAPRQQRRNAVDFAPLPRDRSPARPPAHPRYRIVKAEITSLDPDIASVVLSFDSEQQALQFKTHLKTDPFHADLGTYRRQRGLNVAIEISMGAGEGTMLSCLRLTQADGLIFVFKAAELAEDWADASQGVWSPLGGAANQLYIPDLAPRRPPELARDNTRRRQQVQAADAEDAAAARRRARAAAVVDAEEERERRRSPRRKEKPGIFGRFKIKRKSSEEKVVSTSTNDAIERHNKLVRMKDDFYV